MEHDARKPFRQGYCDAMALALHEQVPGGVLAIWGFQRTAEDGELELEPVHAAVLLRRRPLLWLDVDGLHDAPPNNLLSLAGGGQVVWQEAYPEEMDGTFTSTGVQPEDIAAAHALLAANADLAASVEAVQAQFRDGTLQALGVMPSAEAVANGTVLDDAGKHELEAFEAMDATGRIIHRYRHGDCEDMAMALADLTGYPMVRLSSPRIGFLHSAVQAPDGRLLDAGGWTSLEDVAKLFSQRRVTLSEPVPPSSADPDWVAPEEYVTAVAALWHLGMAGREPFAGMLDRIEALLPAPEQIHPGPESPAPFPGGPP